MRVETGPWWRQAQADLDTAVILLDSRRFYAATWFVQQAVEKGLKSLYIERSGILAPRTHDLDFLGREVAAPTALMSDLNLLNPAFVLTRYPDLDQGIVPVDEVTEEDATRDLAIARRVFTWLEQGLNPESPQH